jgi:hypothetical protein
MRDLQAVYTHHHHPQDPKTRQPKRTIHIAKQSIWLLSVQGIHKEARIRLGIMSSCHSNLTLGDSSHRFSIKKPAPK